MPYADNEHNLPVAFYFKVMFQGGLGEVAFREVSGLSLEREVESIREGGVNDHEHQLPKPAKHGNLVLKRALLPVDHSVEAWIKKCMESDFSVPIVTKDVFITLLNPAKEPLRSWACIKAYPVKWEVESLDAEKNGVLIESLELAYSTLTRRL